MNTNAISVCSKQTAECFRRNAFCLCILFFFSITSFAQGWYKSIDLASNDFGEMTIQTPDGGYFTVGHFGDGASAIEDGFLIKLDADGDQQWMKSYGGDEYDELNHIIPTSDGNYVLFGVTFNPNDGGFNFYLIKVNQLGETLWEKTYGTPAFEKGIKIIQTNDDGYAMIGFQDSPDPSGLNHNFYIVKADENGEELWSTTYGGEELEDGYDLIELADGSLVFVGATGSFGAGDTDFLAVKYSATGVFDWMKTYGGAGEEIAFTVKAAPTGGLYLGGITNSFGAGDYDIYLVETDADGNEVNSNTYGGIVGEWGTQIVVLDDGILLGGSTWSFGSVTHDIYLLKLNFDGSIIWSTILGDDWTDTINGIAINEKGEILISGIEQLFPQNISNAFLIKASPEGEILTNHIQGKVFYDIDESCDFQNGEKEFDRWIVKAEGNKTYYDITDENGFYDLRTDTGTYVLTLVTPNDYWVPCDNEILVTSMVLYDTTTIDFANQIDETCPYLEVDISTNFLIPCESSVYHVNYCNYGKEATVGEVNLQLDEWLIFESSTITPSSINGNNYVFSVPSIAPGECGKFELTVQLDCDVLVGKTHAIQAEISPNEICAPMTGDGASISMRGNCVQDSTVIILKNNGDDMDDPQPLIIIEEQIIARVEQFQLMAGDSLIVVTYPEGKTVFVEAKQTEGHLGRSFPSVAIEGCGAGGGVESLGFVTQYPEDDADFFRSIDAQESAMNFNPQTRTYPKGVGVQSFIQPNRDIEYHVLFQNTTQDTLTHLAIRDTLSTFLDWTTLRPGASSHPYEVDFSNEGILKFSFDDLNLPANAFGFVKFRLSQKNNNPVESMVTNEPEVSLDFSTPNPTNAVAQTVQNEFMFDIFNVDLCWSETFGGISYEGDAVLFSPVAYDSAEVLTTTYIDVHPVYDIEADTAIVAGGTFQNIAVFSDTTVIQELTTWMNCDSTITTNISVFTSTDSPDLAVKNLSVFPNPARDFLFLAYELKTTEVVEWTIYNNLGQSILNQKLAPTIGNITTKIDISALTDGVYYLRMNMKEGGIGRHFLVKKSGN